MYGSCTIAAVPDVSKRRLELTRNNRSTAIATAEITLSEDCRGRMPPICGPDEAEGQAHREHGRAADLSQAVAAGGRSSKIVFGPLDVDGDHAVRPFDFA